VRTSSKRRSLRKQPAVHERRREIGVRLPLDDDAALDDVITDFELLELDSKMLGLPDEIQKNRVSFRKVDAELMPPGSGVRDPWFWRGSQQSAIG
jgi:hypothetical protein